MTDEEWQVIVKRVDADDQLMGTGDYACSTPKMTDKERQAAFANFNSWTKEEPARTTGGRMRGFLHREDPPREEEPNRVWVVFQTDAPERVLVKTLLGVFSTEEKAQQYQELCENGETWYQFEVERWELDEF